MLAERSRRRHRRRFQLRQHPGVIVVVYHGAVVRNWLGTRLPSPRTHPPLGLWHESRVVVPTVGRNPLLKATLLRRGGPNPPDTVKEDLKSSLAVRARN